MADAVAFMTWKRVVPWKILSLKAHPDEPLKPLGFGSRSLDFQNLLRPGAKIWVVTRISNEFSLAGCVTVQDVLDRKRMPRESWPADMRDLLAQWRFVARAVRGQSEFFETNNAGPAIAHHNVRFAQNRTIAYFAASLDESFQACMDQGRATVFLSYRWEEGRRFAIALAREFRRRGWSPWLDALALPAYEARREPGVDAPRLQRLLTLGIEKSRLAVVINTTTFAETAWTRFELDHIRRSGVPWFQVMRGGTQRACDEAPIFSRKPEEVVQEILQRRWS